MTFGGEGTMVTKYRCVRKGVAEYLDWDGRITADEDRAAHFDSTTEASIFLLESMDDTSRWTWEPCREKCVLCGSLV